MLTLALRGEATDILQNLRIQEQEDYNLFEKYLEFNVGSYLIETRIPLSTKELLPKIKQVLSKIRNRCCSISSRMNRPTIQAFLEGLVP